MHEIRWFSTWQFVPRPVAVEVVSSAEELPLEPADHPRFDLQWWHYLAEVSEVKRPPTEAERAATKCRIEAVRLHRLAEAIVAVSREREDASAFGFGEIQGAKLSKFDAPAWTAPGFILPCGLMLPVMLPGNPGFGHGEGGPPDPSESWVYSEAGGKGARRVRAAIPAEVAAAKAAVERYRAHRAACDTRIASMPPGSHYAFEPGRTWVAAWFEWLRVAATGRRTARDTEGYEQAKAVLGELCPWVPAG
jgi:hypothetical protein